MKVTLVAMKFYMVRFLQCKKFCLCLFCVIYRKSFMDHCGKAWFAKPLFPTVLSRACLRQYTTAPKPPNNLVLCTSLYWTLHKYCTVQIQCNAVQSELVRGWWCGNVTPQLRNHIWQQQSIFFNWHKKAKIQSLENLPIWTFGPYCKGCLSTSRSKVFINESTWIWCNWPTTMKLKS